MAGQCLEIDNIPPLNHQFSINLSQFILNHFLNDKKVGSLIFIIKSIFY